MSTAEHDFVQAREVVKSLIIDTIHIIDDIKTHEQENHEFSFNLPSHEGSLAKSLKVVNQKNDGVKCYSNQRPVCQFSDVLNHLHKLKARIMDQVSKVLMTGDLNSGKSTVINAILERNILPTDQQPCTQSFCEVIPFSTAESSETIIGYTTLESIDNNAAGHSLTLGEMTKELQNESSSYKWFRIHSKASEDLMAHLNGTPICIIDSPGLNTDLFKTAALFSHQRDIDVVVFVINASFHLTLSGKEFLEQAAKEKVKMFFIVNKFDEIERPDKCRKLILRQIQEILPETFSDSSDLIHFVSAREYFKEFEVEPPTQAVDGGNHQMETPLESIGVNIDDESKLPLLAQPNFRENFLSMRSALLSFLYLKRKFSKLSPAKIFCTRLLQDLVEVSAFNTRCLTCEYQKNEAKLEESQSSIDKFRTDEPNLRDDLTKIVSQSCHKCSDDVKAEAIAFTEIMSKSILDEHFSGIWGIQAFNSRIFLKYSSQYGRYSVKTNEIIAVSKRKGMEQLSAVSLNYQVSDASPVSTPNELKIVLPFPLQKPNILDLIDFKAAFEGFGAFNITSVVSAMVGYQPLVNLVWRLSGRFKINPIFLSLSIAGGLGAYVLYTASSALQRTIRSRLHQYYSSRFSRDFWAVEEGEKARNGIAVALSSRSSQIVTNYRRFLDDNVQVVSSLSCSQQRLNEDLVFLRRISVRVENLLKYSSAIQL